MQDQEEVNESEVALGSPTGRAGLPLLTAQRPSAIGSPIRLVQSRTPQKF